jgi:signal transduction histidine kinase/pSer/pThr/pTyr-binding forkhead associated (FHA) protein
MPSPTTSLAASDVPPEPEVRFHPIPHRTAEHAGKRRPVWRVRFEVTTSPGKRFGLDINDEIVLGRGMDSTNIVDMTPYLGEELGVSRRHVILRPTSTNLYAIDTGSKNGTLRNGQSIGVNAPYPVNNGDTLNLGRLQLEIHIVDRPVLAPENRDNLTEALSQLAQAITSQLDIEQVFNRITETAMHLTQAGETGIWLVDDQTQELFLRAQRGISDEHIRLMRIPGASESPVNQVIKTGQPLMDHREPGQEKIKVKTGYLVEALLFLPINLGGVTIGVLMAVHRSPGQTFNTEDERLLKAIADFAAIAIQNARQYQATDEALNRRVKELAAINELTGAVSSSLDLGTVQEMVVRHVQSHWDVEDVILWLEDEGDGNLYPFNEEEETVTRIIRAAGGQVESIIREVQETRQPKAADFLGQEGQMSGSGKRATIQIQARSIACIPLLLQGRVTGILSLFRKKSGMFSADDLDHLLSFANPVATAVENARLFQESERQRAAIQATANALLQPLLILDENGEVLISNQPAQEIIDRHMAELFNGISRSIGSTTEIEIGERTFLTTSHHTPAVGTIVVMQDITYVKKLEKDQATFVYTLTHDLKSPVTSIKGWAQLVEQVTKLDDKGKRFVDQIVSSSDRMLEMIAQMLKVASQVDTIKIEQEPLDVKVVIERALNDLEGAIMSKGIQVDVKTPVNGLMLLGDQDRLYHMVLNLVSNAVKYTPNDEVIRISLNTDETGVQLRIQDRGPGIPEDELPHVFDKYFRGKTAQKLPGVGLGLSVVKSVAEAHGGKVGVKNMSQGGAEFIVLLPAALVLPSAA